MKNYSLAILLAAGLIIPSMTVDAEAASIRVKCEKRGDRSRVSVDAKDLAPGEYSAEILSGANEVVSDGTQTVAPGADQVEFDFDSNPKDVAAGATEISSDFIQGQVIGKVIDADGFSESETVNCRVR